MTDARIRLGQYELGLLDAILGAPKQSEKRRELLELAKQRHVDRLEDYYCLADFHDGFYECDYVSPWTISACNVDAEVMLIGQDWLSSDVLEQEPDEERRTLGQDQWRDTNVNLRGVFLPQIGLQFGQTYATNVFSFIKRGDVSARIRRSDLEKCASTYTLREIEIVSPRMAICLGRATFEAVRRAVGLAPIEWIEAWVPGPHTPFGSVEIYGVPHPAARYPVYRGTKLEGEEAVVVHIWRRLGKHLKNMAQGR
jgi:hypothetical protein